MKRVAVVAGPTASGKTALAVALAQALDGEVVSADSMQVYRRLDIGTAKPTEAERGGIPHHMLDVAEPGEHYSVSRYVAEATACVEDILARGKLPILCGGTGLYIDGLIRGGGFLPPADPALRARLEAEWAQSGPEAMLARLRGADPDTAARLHPNDKKRILRALEVWLATGETITGHNARTQSASPRYQAAMIGLYTDPRAVLYRRIEERVDGMLEQGLLCEAETLYKAGDLRGTAAQAIGYKELLGFFRGEAGLGEAVALIKRKSCQYAKRQLTWFRADGRIHWILYNRPEESRRTLWDATEFLKARR